MLETKDLIVKKSEFDDWKDLYDNIWNHRESAEYMLWKVTDSEKAAKERMEKVIKFEELHPFHWTVYEKKSGKAIGWVGLEEIEEGAYEDQGIALGPAFVGKGYGKQLVNVLIDFVKEELGGRKIVLSYRRQNIASKKLAESCGFVYLHSESKIDPRTGEPYILEYAERVIDGE